MLILVGFNNMSKKKKNPYISFQVKQCSDDVTYYFAKSIRLSLSSMHNS